jgi:hypothetical protein
MTNNKIDKNARIAIVGAGPAGLSTAWFLSKNGYHNVTVLEKLGRVGGLCKSITIDGMSYDLGANYVTWAYTEVLKIAKQLGATTYREEPYTSIELYEEGGKQKIKFRTIEDAILRNPKTGEKISRMAFFVAALRYLIIRIKLSPVIDPPGAFAKIDGNTRPDLVVSFSKWLDSNTLTPLETLFSFPITIMGYGQLDQIATPYALKYMSVKTFIPMFTAGTPGFGWLNKWLLPWPRRFTMGFQRLWEKVAWRTNLRLNIKIEQIERPQDGPISITFQYPQQEMNTLKIVRDTMEFDYLVLACPLTPDVFKQLGLQLNPDETTMSEKIKVMRYCMTTFWINDMNMPRPIAPMLPIPKVGLPWAVARQFQKLGNNFTQFYTLQAENMDDAQVVQKVKWLVSLMRGRIDTTHSRWHSFDKFTYFQHVTSEDWGAGFYGNLAAMQGSDRTFYVGGVTNFELVEPIVEHSKHIVESRFVGSVP